MKKFGADVFLIVLFAAAGAAAVCLTLYTLINLTHAPGFDPEPRRALALAASLAACLSSVSIIIGISCFLRNISGNISSRRQINQQNLMARLSRDFISVSDTSALINDALRITGEFFDVGRVLVGITDEIAWDTGRAVFLWSKTGGDMPFPNSRGLAELINKAFPAEQPEEIPVYCCNNTDNPAYGMMRKVGIKSFIAVPLYLEKKFWAVLSIENLKYRKWTESERQFAGMVSGIISAAVERDMREKDRDAARRQAETASRAKGDFLANMSHEMRTPMNAIIGMTAIAKKTGDVEKKEYCLNRIENASTYLLGIINDVLDMSKIEANKFSLSSDEFNFERMIRKIVNVLNFKIAEKKQTFSIHIDQRIPDYLYGDEMRFSQVIANLLFNAVKFTPEGGSIRLDAALEDQQEDADPGGLEPVNDSCALRIRVSDTGIGISDEQKSRLFSAFEQVDSGISRKYGGIGLGLAISKNIIEKMDGEITVVSTPGKGSTFIFTVCLKKSFRRKNSESVNWKNIRVLAVDDDQYIRDYFTGVAEKLGFICDTASGGEEALYKINNAGPYNFFFINRILSDMDGIELSRQIKNTVPRGSLALMVSPTDWNALDAEAGKTGADLFISKPFFISGIVDTISRCIGSEDQIAALNVGGTGKNYEGRTIMLVEDVDINREIVLALLEPFGFTVICAENGLEALKLFKHSPGNFDLILMDVQMPEMDGLEATRRIREFEAETFGPAKRVPIVALTANVFREDIERCLQAGMDDHAGKPLDANIVMDKLARYL